MLRIRKDRHVLFNKPFFETGLVFAFFLVKDDRYFNAAVFGVDKRLGDYFVLKFVCADVNFFFSTGDGFKNRIAGTALRRKLNFSLCGDAS